MRREYFDIFEIFNQCRKMQNKWMIQFIRIKPRFSTCNIFVEKKKPVKFVVFDLVIHMMLVNLEMLIMNFITKNELNNKNMKKLYVYKGDRSLCCFKY